MTKAQLEKKVAELLDANKFLNEEVNALQHQLQLAEQGGGHTEAYDELMDKARELQRELNLSEAANVGLRKTINIVKSAIA